MFETAGQPEASSADRAAASDRFLAVRRESERLTEDLTAEDQAIQSMPDVSPTKWHLAHTTWFFETFILRPLDKGYRAFDPAFGYLFNSYYEALGARQPRPERGLLSRPSVETIAAYRDHVEGAMVRMIGGGNTALWREAAPLVELGLQHEQQHQELILMDIKHVFSVNPLRPAYHGAVSPRANFAPPFTWIEFPGGLTEIGHSGTGFAFDNETPRHKVWLDPFRIGSRPATCGEYLAFIEDGGYRRPEFWLSDGWTAVCQQGWQAPLYWRRDDGVWSIFTLAGERPLDLAEPVCHVSYYEADAFARWAGKRLPSEAEWEIAAREVPLAGNLADARLYHPAAAVTAMPDVAGRLLQMIGDVWEWTASPYIAYPRFRPAAGAVGEYNGKFMCNQMVLRGGAAITSAGHVRATYRNFFPCSARWAFAGLRLADDG
jgi:ergothioneine biosynthesis protein EgtB